MVIRKIKFRYIILFIFILLFMYIVGRVFICDSFYIPTSSMEPTLLPGDRIIVNKVIFGARIYKNYDFKEGYNLESWRVKSLRKIKPNDIVVFNAPAGYKRNKLEFNISYVYCKRCIGTPGDTISIINGYFKNNNFPEPIGDSSQQERLANIDINLISPHLFYTIPYDTVNFNCTIKNMDPLWVPSKGCSINLDSQNYKLYSRIIAYELRSDASFRGDTLIINNTPITNYTFNNNYYFACGDNVLNSGDSRYWGFIPEDFIIGVAKIKLRKGEIWSVL